MAVINRHARRADRGPVLEKNETRFVNIGQKLPVIPPDTCTEEGEERIYASRESE